MKKIMFSGFVLVSTMIVAFTLTITFNVKSQSKTSNSKREGNFEIYMMTSDGSNPVNLSNNAAFDVCPAWSPKTILE
nr:hypothetical protein [Bacteroidota bacterium]